MKAVICDKCGDIIEGKEKASLLDLCDKCSVDIKEDPLDSYMECHDMTIREFFKECLMSLVKEGERFSGKRPIGESGWHADIAIALLKHKHIDGFFNEDEFDYDYKDVDNVLESCIGELFDV